ncbi:hypothetical protein OIU85_026529 [Salix viminalis]|uniref:Uncharacterized protein n=1 Tax=Salix viminalis TaxID=40686 RepID=A0A9Q0YYR5_SALVM|nr:hypothetical protein OIU85_026529 [Salix viminalis]
MWVYVETSYPTNSDQIYRGCQWPYVLETKGIIRSYVPSHRCVMGALHTVRRELQEAFVKIHGGSRRIAGSSSTRGGGGAAVAVAVAVSIHYSLYVAQLVAHDASLAAAAEEEEEEEEQWQWQ